MSLLTASIVKNNHILAGIYFLRKCLLSNLKSFQYGTWTSVKRSGKHLSSKANFSTFLQISCSNFRLKLCQSPSSWENYQTNQIWKGLGRLRSKKVFPETINHLIFEANSSFHVNSTLLEKFNLYFLGGFC